MIDLSFISATIEFVNTIAVRITPITIVNSDNSKRLKALCKLQFFFEVFILSYLVKPSWLLTVVALVKSYIGVAPV